MNYSGQYIVFEGGEGVGKTTQIKRLSERLMQAGIDHITTREPGGTPGAEAIRELLVTNKGYAWDAVTDTLLHMAARRDVFKQIIEPSLIKGTWVISDRSYLSTIAYQGFGHELGYAYVMDLHTRICPGLKADLAIILDIDPKLGLSRARGRNDHEQRYESMALAFHERVRSGFSFITQHEAHTHQIDATDSIDHIHTHILELLEVRFKVKLV